MSPQRHKDTKNVKIEDRIEELRNQLREHEYRYYVLAEPTVSDYEFDQMEEEIERPKLGIDVFLKAVDGQYRVILKDYQVVIEKVAGHTV